MSLDYRHHEPGRFKLILSDFMADTAIKAGLLTEDDIIRITPMPTTKSKR